MRKFLLIPLALSRRLRSMDSRPEPRPITRGRLVRGVLVRAGRRRREIAASRNFEACRMEVIAGNRGFCRQNARWPGWHSNYAAAPRKATQARIGTDRCLPSRHDGVHAAASAKPRFLSSASAVGSRPRNAT